LGEEQGGRFIGIKSHYIGRKNQEDGPQALAILVSSSLIKNQTSLGDNYPS